MSKQTLYTQTIAIVEDNIEFAQLLMTLLDSVSLKHCHFFNAEDFLCAIEKDTNKFGCLLCDVRLQGISGLQLHQILKERANKLPIIFISGHGNIKMAVKTIQDGACHFLTKPINHQEALDAIFSVLRTQKQESTHLIDCEHFYEQANKLSNREKQILSSIAKGMKSKEIADELAISANTVEVHRATIMKKMAISSISVLISQAATARFHYTPAS